MPDFVDPRHRLALPGREEQWSLVTEYRVRLAQEARQWDEAERLQRLQVEWATQKRHALPRPAARVAQRLAEECGKNVGGFIERTWQIQFSEQGKPNVLNLSRSITLYQNALAIKPVRFFCPSTSVTLTYAFPPCATWRKPRGGISAHKAVLI